MDDTGRAVLDLISGYADTWRLLHEFDEDRLAVPTGAKPATSELDYEPPGAHRAYPAHRRERAAQQRPDGPPRRQSAGKAGRVTRFTESGVEDPVLGMARRPRPVPWPWSRHCPDRPGAESASPTWEPSSPPLAGMLPLAGRYAMLGPCQPLGHHPGSESRGRCGDRPHLLREGGQDHVDGPPP